MKHVEYISSSPCHVSKYSTISDIKAENNWRRPSASPEHQQEHPILPIHYFCRLWIPEVWPRICTSAKIEVTWEQGAKAVYQSPVPQSTVLACLGLKAQGKSWCCDPLLNRWMVTCWNRLSGETVQFPALEVSEVSCSPIAQWIYNSSFHEWVKTLPQLSKQHAKDKLLFLHLFPLSRRENKTWGENAERKERVQHLPTPLFCPCYKASYVLIHIQKCMWENNFSLLSFDPSDIFFTAED